MTPTSGSLRSCVLKYKFPFELDSIHMNLQFLHKVVISTIFHLLVSTCTQKKNETKNVYLIMSVQLFSSENDSLSMGRIIIINGRSTKPVLANLRDYCEED